MKLFKFSAAKNYQRKNEQLEKKDPEGIEIFLKKRKTKSKSMVVRLVEYVKKDHKMGK